MDYLIGNRALALFLAVIVSAAVSFLFSYVLSWATKRSPLWSMGFAIAVAMIGTLVFLAIVVGVLRRYSF